MADQPRDKSKSKAEPEKKQIETVLLTGEELRAIAGGGGATVNPPPPIGTRTPVKAPPQ